MFRRLSTRWALAVLLSVALPFVGFAAWVETHVSQRLAEDAVRFHLLSTASDLADQLDGELQERWQDLEYLAGVPLVSWFVGGPEEERPLFESTVQDLFDRMARLSGVHGLVLAVDRDGRVLATDRGAEGQEASDTLRRAALGLDLAGVPWLEEVLARGRASLGFGTASALLGLPAGGPPFVGMAVRLSPGSGEEPSGAVVALMGTDRLQARIESFGVRRLGATGEQPLQDLYASSYAWLWGPDADTILAHPTRALVGTRVSELQEGELQPLVEAARGAPWGMYPDYTFRGIQKKAAFKRTAAPEQGGFGWTVGIGADFSDIYAPVQEVSRTLLLAAALGLVSAAVLTFFVARRTAQPIQELEAHTRRLAAGDLEQRLGWSRRDELGDLARGFDRMAGELAEGRRAAMRADKDAAWREMARQVAHEIKNPLTPISLSIGLLRRAREEGSPEAESILVRTMDMIERQVAAMREIARDFHSFAGQHRDLEPVDLGALLDEVLELSAAWAAEQGVQLVREGDGGLVLGDPGELRRALLNLVSNAIEASDEGGELRARCGVLGHEVEVELVDSGRGLDPEQEQHLFEPYFTTRTSGTGLGLAIVRRVVEDLGGRVSLENRSEGRGAVARIVLPLWEQGAAS
ncbi:MAG: HAMP domain-containing protein [Planctomycetes bacterium]|nr:HAMP domain-containing protein [Planctomycetota bacterium]